MFKKQQCSSMEELKIRLMEEGKIDFKEREMIELLKKNEIKFEDFMNFVDDGKHYTNHVMKFIFQVTFSVSIVVFGMIMIATDETKNNSIYLPLISAILGYWLPSPDYARPPQRKPRTWRYETEHASSTENTPER